MRDRKNVAMQAAERLGCSYAEKQSGLFVWAKAPDHIADVEKWIDEILYGTKVFITPGFIFGEAGRTIHKNLLVLYSGDAERSIEAY